MSLTQEQKLKLRNAIEDPNVEFVFLPSAELKRRIANGTDPRLSKLASKLTVTMLQISSGQGIILDKNLVMKMVSGNLDENHEYVFSLGEVIVVPSPNSKIIK